MNFDYNISLKDEILEIRLSGFLDTGNGEILMKDLKGYIGKKIIEVVILAKDLEYISSLGVRILVFLKQKLGYDVNIVLKEPREDVVSVLEMSGMLNSISVE